METGVPSIVTTGLIVVSTLFPTLSLISIIFRYKARHAARQSFQADDWWIVVSWVSTLALSINAWVFGSIMGVNVYKIDAVTGVSRSLMCILITGAILQVSLTVVKISILLFYKRIFSTQKFKFASWCAIMFISAWGIIFFFLLLFAGDPVSAAWTGKGRFRFDITKLGVAQAGTSIALDIVVLVFPIPVLWGLHMKTRRKIAIALIFWLGAFCCVAAIVRLVLLNATLAKVAASGYTVYLQSRQYIFMMLEPNCSIIAACLPCYGPLLANGKGLSSILSSVRSVFSIRSHGSKGSSNSKSPHHTKADYTDTARPGGVSNESQVELAQASEDWLTAQGRNTVNIERYSQGTDEERSGFQGQGIYMTRGVNVTST